MENLEEYLETYFEVVAFIERRMNLDIPVEESRILSVRESEGIGGIYTLAKEWTDKFQETFKYHQWDGDFLEKIDSFLIEMDKI